LLAFAGAPDHKPHPMSALVKICGINSAAAAEAVLRAGAEYAGLNFFPHTPRHVPLDKAVSLADQMRGRLKLVALVVDEDDAMLARIAEGIKPDFFQLHGKESVSRTADIRGRFGIPAIKVLAIAERDDLKQTADYEPVADMLMFDAKAPQGADRPGGHGAAFDWQMLKGVKPRRPWLLAGGLNPENVGRAIAISGAPMVDVASGVESAPGVKNENLISAFVTAARQQVAA
jgi:phosphoribosylanthranilate isomerase